MLRARRIKRSPGIASSMSSPHPTPPKPPCASSAPHHHHRLKLHDTFLSSPPVAAQQIRMRSARRTRRSRTGRRSAPSGTRTRRTRHAAAAAANAATDVGLLPPLCCTRRSALVHCGLAATMRTLLGPRTPSRVAPHNARLPSLARDARPSVTLDLHPPMVCSLIRIQ
jgi:hypothetical protein